MEGRGRREGEVSGREREDGRRGKWKGEGGWKKR